MKLDTISYCIAVFALLTLVDFRRKSTIFIYLVLNLVALGFFSQYILKTFVIDPNIVLEYTVDNLVAFLFVAIICYHSITINRNALNKAEEAIQLTNLEISKNQELARSLEQQVAKRTQQLMENNIELENEIRERIASESKLKEAQHKIIDAAHKAGMAEIAADSLHNVGNILNSVQTSAYVINRSLDNSPINSYKKACALVRENSNDLKEFFLNNEKGEKSIKYFLLMEDEFSELFDEIKDNVIRLQAKFDLINNVIMALQNHAISSSFTEQVDIAEIIEDSLHIVTELQEDCSIGVLKNFENVPLVELQKGRLIQILIILFKNSVNAIREYPEGGKQIFIDLFANNNTLNIKITHTGKGIRKEHQKKIFTQGFSTGEKGLGYGLHSCANYVIELGGSIIAQSEGENKGVSFILHLPMK